MRATGPTPAIRALVKAREDDACAICGRRTAPFQIHHRRPRGIGGTRRLDTNSPANLVLLDDCHAGIESHRTVAYLNGWLVPQQADPALVPFLYRGRMVLLTELGAVEPTEVSA